MFSRVIWLFTLLINLSWFGIPAYADTSQANDKSVTNEKALASFLLALEGMENFQASFVQSSKTQTGEILQQMEGSLSVAKPGKMRWQTEDPFAQLVVSDGRLIWVYDMDLEQVTIRNMDQRVQETPALLLSGNTQEIDASFVVGKTTADENVIYQLMPKDSSQLFQSLEFHYRGHILQGMKIYDAAGQITDIVFTQQKQNQVVDEQAFVFDVPEGVDVIDGRSL